MITADFIMLCGSLSKYGFANVGGQFRLILQNLVDLESLKLTRRGKIFSSELAEREIEVQYVSDGLQAELTESEITVHKDIARCTDWMYYACILTVETFQTE
jgi:hypothetical protein